MKLDLRLNLDIFLSRVFSLIPSLYERNILLTTLNYIIVTHAHLKSGVNFSCV